MNAFQIMYAGALNPDAVRSIPHETIIIGRVMKSIWRGLE